MATEVTPESVINALLDQIRDLSLKIAMLEAARTTTPTSPADPSADESAPR